MEIGKDGKEHEKNPNFFGIFCFFNGDDTNTNAAFRFGIVNDKVKNSTKIRWNAGYKDDISDFSDSQKDAHNIGYKIESSKLNSGSYITVTLDATDHHTVSDETALNQRRKPFLS